MIVSPPTPKYKKALRILRKNCFIDQPVSVRRVKMCNDGDCGYRNKKFYIRINNSLSETESIDALIHEVGHILAWHKEGDDHGLEWGKAYSRVYRIFLKNYFSDN